MAEKRRQRRGKKPGPQPLPRNFADHQQVAAHPSPGLCVEHCISLARCITREQYSQLVDIHLATGKTVDKLVHEAAQGYLERFSTPNRPNT
jgi:hypothetical protein